MQGASFPSANATQGPSGLVSGSPTRDALAARLHEVRLELAAKGVSQGVAVLFEILDQPEMTADARRDALSTRLMELFRLHQSGACFGLLYELNGEHLLAHVSSRLRRYQSKSDPRDVLQEVFFNIYRYPHRFDCGRDDAFRVWTATIVRNTVLKHLRSLARHGRSEVAVEDLSEQPESGAPSPLGGIVERESEVECGRVYLTYLHLYLRFYSMLSERERTAIHMVEVEERSYREAAAELGIKLENLKMVIFRARRKIHRSMRRVFDGLPPDCKPARDPLARSGLDDWEGDTETEEGELALDGLDATNGGSTRASERTRAARRGSAQPGSKQDAKRDSELDAQSDSELRSGEAPA